MTRMTPVAAATLTVLLAACGTESTPDPQGGSMPTAQHVVVDPTAELVGVGMLRQSDEAGPVELCVGGVADSYPPQCGGPALEGEFSWDEVESETAHGVTWSQAGYYAVGHYDPSGSGDGTFTLTRPVSIEPPEGFAPPDAEEVTFPQLCEDPTGDVPDASPAGRTDGSQAVEEQNALHDLTQELDGFVTMWVSDGGAVMNVVVNVDPHEARAQIREVFTGPLCVEERDLPTEQDLREAQDAVHAEFAELGLLGSGGDGTTGLLHVQALVADRPTVDRVHELVEPWLTPEQVVIYSALLPLEP